VSATKRVEVTTTINAPREKVFDAWLTADRMARFLSAFDSTVAEVEVDPRVGGTFRIVMAGSKGSHDHRGKYLEIDRPSVLRFTWASPATDGEDTEVTITFDDVEGGTRVTLVHVGLRDAQAAERHTRGWLSILSKCQSELER
jgi:uncharacterized protein YndB with AHSA1/START domain